MTQVPPMTAWPPTEPADVELLRGDARLAVDLRGGGLRALTVSDRAVIDGYPAGTVPEGRGGRRRLPWPNQLRAGRRPWAGQELELDVAAPEKPNALHGLLSWQPFTVLSRFSD